MLVSGKAMLTKYFKNSLCTFSDLKTTQNLTFASKVMSRGYLTVFHLFLTLEILRIIFSLSVQPKRNLKMQWLASSITFIHRLCYSVSRDKQQVHSHYSGMKNPYGSPRLETFQLTSHNVDIEWTGQKCPRWQKKDNHHTS